MKKNLIFLWFTLGFLVSASAQVVPEIKVLTPDPCVPGRVELAVINCSSCVKFEWQVGSGASIKTTTIPDFQTIVQQPGWYDVTVKIYTSNGAKMAIGKKNAFYGRPGPKAGFTVNKTSICNGTDTLTVTDTSKGAISRNWLIDGTVYYNTGAVVKHVLNGNPGFKSIYLIAVDSWGCKGSVLKDSAISLWKPVAITANPSVTTGCTPKSIRYNPTFDTTLQNIKSVKWYFEGATPDSSSKTYPGWVQYNRGDTFDVTVKLTTVQGCEYDVHYNNLLNLGDSVNLKIIVPKTKLCINEKMNLVSTGSKTGRPIWDVKGGSPVADSFVGNVVPVKFTDTGMVTLRVTEWNRTCLSEANYNKPIQILGPKAGFASEYPFYCGFPKKLVFTNTSVEDPTGTSYAWTVLEDNVSPVSTGTAKDHNYTTNVGKNYGVRLIAKGNNGCIDTLFRKTASRFGSIDSGFIVKPNPVCPGYKTELKANAGRGSKTAPNSFRWYFFDASGNVVKTDTAFKTSYTYANIGDYSAKLVISNTENCKDSAFFKDTIHVLAPTAKIYASDTMVCLNQRFTLFAGNKNTKLKTDQFWVVHNIDSIADFVVDHADTFHLSLLKTGRWAVSYNINDTSAGGCSNTLILPNKIYVSGVKYTSTASPTFGCSPFTSSVSAKQVFNVNYKNASTSVSYSWRHKWPEMVTFADSTKLSTTAKAYKGDHPIWMVYKNGAGCVDSTPGILLKSGLTTAFEFTNGAHCIYTWVSTNNVSSNWATSFRWECDSASVKFSPSKTAKNPAIMFTKPGWFPIRLISTYMGCEDTFVMMAEGHHVVANFYTPDTVSFCAPKLINILNNTVGAVFNRWYFGNGDTTTTRFNETAGHLFQKNSNDGITVTLITRDGNGCMDTLEKKNYLKIIGPEPDFSVSGASGCEPLYVKFTNKSKAFSRMYMDYDNGVVIDSTKLVNYYYTVTDKSLPVQNFVPRMLLYDSLGCSALQTSVDTIKVKKNAEAKYTYYSPNFLRKTEGCAGDLLLKFTNQSKFYIRNYWDFDNDGQIDAKNQETPNWLYRNAGVFYPTIIAEHINGCRDTFFHDSIVVWAAPEAGFTTNADTSCAIDPVKFKNTTKAPYPLTKLAWNFGELPIYVDTSSQPNPIWKYKTPFDHLVVFDVLDKNGCKSQVIKNIYILDTAGPAAPEAAYITVKNTGEVLCVWNATKIGNFFQYHTYLDSVTYKERYRSYNRKDTTVTWNYGNLTDNRRFCFAFRLEDTCNQLGKFSGSHCTIVLRDSVWEPFHIQLKWLAYDWWGTDLSHYEIFRKDPGGNFVKITDVKGNRQIYIDSFLCDFTYEYYVEAVHRNRIFRSRSNVIKAHPIYIKPQFPVHTHLATVEHNSFAGVYWEPYPVYYRNYSYVLERSSSGNAGSFVQVFDGKALYRGDITADVHTHANYYQVRFKDHCGVTGQPGCVSNTIWLHSVSKTRNNTSLLWNPYNYWYSGVREYGLQVRNKAGQFQTIATGKNMIQKDSMDVEKLGLDSICFRVYAVKDSTTADTSWSNELCMVPGSWIFVPNTFTPDGNQMNEVFKPTAGFIHKHSDDPQKRYEMRVYNRWGQEVFFTDNFDEGWDGSYQQQACQAGMYIYTVKALGFDGVPHILKGTVLLMR